MGYKPERLRDAGFRDFMLQDFDAGQIEEFLKLWHQITFSDHEEAERKRQRLAKAIADSRPIKLLAGNPLLLTLMAIINRKEELPRNRARLYEKAAELLLQQWDTEAKLLSDFPSLSAEIDLRAKAAILRKVALEMQTAGGKAANLIQGERLIKLIEEYLLTELRFPQARAAANALVEQLRQRNFILCFLGGDSYGFVHRTFLEYFCAAEFVDQFKERQTLKIDGLLALYDQHCREDDWQEVLRLICGQLDESFAGKIIEHLTGLVDMKKIKQLRNIDYDRPLFPELTLATWCLSDVRALSKINEKICTSLLLKIVELFLQGRITVREKIIIDATRAIGCNWPGKYNFDFCGQIPIMGWYSCRYWPIFLADVFQQRQWIEKLYVAGNNHVCIGSLKALALYWLDENTFRLLIRESAQNKSEFIRGDSVRLLLKHLSTDEKLSKIIQEYCSTNGAATSLHGKTHSPFGRLVFQENPAGGFSFLNPQHPILDRHIQKAAKKAGIPPDKIDEAVRSLSAHMGWDITKGSLAGKL